MSEARRLPRMPPPVWATTAAFAGFHLILGALLWLVQDEAYYALWSTHLQPAYYDHPPMIALWIRAGEALLGATPMGVRLVAILGFALVTPVTAAIARAAGGDETSARWAALMFNCMALPFALGFTATPDAPSTLFWAVATLTLLKAPESRGGMWLLSGVLLALGVVSKLTNLFLGAGLVLWLLATREGRAQLRRPVVWAAALLTLALLAPFLWWSAGHDWLGLARQFGRLGTDGPTQNQTLAFVGGTILTVTPLLAWRAGAALWCERAPARRLIWLGAPLVAYLLIHSLRHTIEANWIAPLFPAIAVLAAYPGRPAQDRRGARLRLPGWRPGRSAAAFTGLGLSALALTLALWPGKPVFRGDNPPNQTKGWQSLAPQITALAREQGAEWIATVHYGTTGAVFFAVRGLPVWQVTSPERWGFRGGFPRALCDKPALLVQAQAQSTAPLSLFRTAGATRTLTRDSAGAVIGRYLATKVSGVKGGPCAAGGGSGG